MALFKAICVVVGLMIAAKFVGILAWSWWLILSPVWVSFCLWFVAVITVCASLFIDMLG